VTQPATADNLITYYAARAAEYDEIYLKPVRQEDIASLRVILRELLAGHVVLEVACGTGFWTAEIAATAKSIYATDVNARVLEIASNRLARYRNVSVHNDDAFKLSGTSRVFTATFAGFWWSHLRRGSELIRFLDVLHAKLPPDALVVFIDNRYVAGSSLPITREDADGNTYQKRRLRDGTEHEVLKNFPDEAELRSLLQGRGGRLDFRWLTYYWCMSYRTRGISEPVAGSET
jgi:demethylmenaquinone methyltransferase/2-methoxy-6-polyprenyl-1,4-benzoquinol methylase